MLTGCCLSSKFSNEFLDIFLVNFLPVGEVCLWNGIFLPKVETFLEIESVYKKINSSDLKVVPIIESINGVKNLITILEEDKNKIISYIHYGHFDYCLNSMHFHKLLQRAHQISKFPTKTLFANNCKYINLIIRF